MSHPNGNFNIIYTIYNLHLHYNESNINDSVHGMSPSAAPPPHIVVFQLLYPSGAS